MIQLRWRPSHLLTLIAGALALLAAGCPSDIDATPGCGLTGTISVCSCSEGDGQRVCQADRTWGACECSDVGLSDVGDAGAGDTTEAIDQGNDISADAQVDFSTDILGDSQDEPSDLGNTQDDTSIDGGEVGSDIANLDSDIGDSDDGDTNLPEDADASDLNLDVADTETTDTADEPDSAPVDPGYFYYTDFRNGGVYRIEGTISASPESLSDALDLLYPSDDAGDRRISVSHNGEWMVLQTRRVIGGHTDCAGWDCLLVARTDLTELEIVANIAGTPIRSGESRVAISNDGNLIVTPIPGETDERYLHAVVRADGYWETPVLLIPDSPYASHWAPVLDPTETRVLFTADDAELTSSVLASVDLSGENPEVIFSASDWTPEGGEILTNDLRHPAMFSNGDILFQGSWFSSQLWVLSPGGEVPTRLTSALFWGEVEPCILPSGMVAAGWGGREGAEGPEPTLIDPDSGQHTVLVEGMHVIEGVSCGGSPPSAE